MNTPVMTLSPEAVQSTPTGTSVWEKALIEYVREAAAEGKTIMVSTEVKTMTTEEVAQGLGLSRSTVSRRIADGAITSMKIGNRHHVPYPEYRRLWEEQMKRLVESSTGDSKTEPVNRQ